MNAFLFNVAFFLAKTILKSFLTPGVRTTVYSAIDIAEQTQGTGQEKMDKALEVIKAEGPELLKAQGESALRTLVELALDKYL